jgi:hypothetical protein
MRASRAGGHIKIAAAICLTSVMNATRWHQLFSALEPMREGLDFRRRDIREEDFQELRWSGDLYEMFGLPEFIEWLDIRGEDHEELSRTLRQLKLPFEEHGFGLRIYGYLRAGAAPSWE